MNAATLAPIALIVSSVVLYQLAQKLLSKGLDHWYALLLYYALAFALTLIAIVFARPQQSVLEAWKSLNWAVPAVALSIVGIELGWILVFRAGGSLSLTGLIVNVTVAVVVIPLGLALFGERVSALNLVGMALCVAGLALIAVRA